MRFSRQVPAWVAPRVHTGLLVLLALCAGGGGIDRVSASDTHRGDGHRVARQLTPNGEMAESWRQPPCERRVAERGMRWAGAALICASDAMLQALDALAPPWATLTQPLAIQLRRVLPARWQHRGCRTRGTCHACGPGRQTLDARNDGRLREHSDCSARLGTEIDEAASRPGRNRAAFRAL